jgi:hypothetical protein
VISFEKIFYHFRSPVYRRRIKRTVAGVATFLGYANDHETDELGALARAALALRTARLLRKTGHTAITGGGSVVVFPGLPSA